VRADGVDPFELAAIPAQVVLDGMPASR